jgi:arylsulfatase
VLYSLLLFPDVAKFLESFKEFPPRQKPGSFSIDQVMENMERAGGGGGN